MRDLWFQEEVAGFFSTKMGLDLSTSLVSFLHIGSAVFLLLGCSRDVSMELFGFLGCSAVC